MVVDQADHPHAVVVHGLQAADVVFKEIGALHPQNGSLATQGMGVKNVFRCPRYRNNPRPF